MKILIVEDHAAIRDTLRDILELNGHEVLAAEDGVQGVKQEAVPSVKKPVPDGAIADRVCNKTVRAIPRRSRATAILVSRLPGTEVLESDAWRIRQSA